MDSSFFQCRGDVGHDETAVWFSAAFAALIATPTAAADLHPTCVVFRKIMLNQRAKAR
jgi:hypothetical protein